VEGKGHLNDKRSREEEQAIPASGQCAEASSEAACSTTATAEEEQSGHLRNRGDVQPAADGAVEDGAVMLVGSLGPCSAAAAECYFTAFFASKSLRAGIPPLCRMHSPSGLWTF
jgi:hypothetical protein